MLDDHQAPANDQNHENQMETEHGHIPGVDDTTLLSNVSDEFVLPPISTAAQTSTVRQAVRRKRKLVIDEVKEIDSGSMKTQLSDTTDIVGVLELAPPTRRLMHLKETGGIEKLFSLSASSIYSKTLQQVRRGNDINP
jgi:cohesin complex subunit SCC1